MGRRIPAQVARLAAVAVVAAACGSSKRVLEGSAPMPTTTTTSTTSTTVPPCPQASVPTGVTTTQLATPITTTEAYATSAGGPLVGHLRERWGGPSTRPVIDTQNGWIEVRLNTRPNGSIAWLPLTSVTLSTTQYRIVISICQRSLTLFQGDTAVYSAPVGVGRPQWPTPVGSTFVDAVVNTPRYQQYIYGPTVLIMGAHSDVFTEFDGGDGTVAIHGYPSDTGSTRGVQSSHGCVRAGPDTINAIKVVPVGTPIDVIA